MLANIGEWFRFIFLEVERDIYDMGRVDTERVTMVHFGGPTSWITSDIPPVNKHHNFDGVDNAPL